MSLSTSNLEYVYEKFRRRVISEDDRGRDNYPKQDPLDPTIREARDGNGQALTLQRSFASSYECERCGEEFQVDDEGKSLAKYGVCHYHHSGRRLFNIGFGVMGHYCCKKREGTTGCCRNRYHVHKDEPLVQNYSGFVETQPKPDWGPSQHGVYALDCEMCYTVYGQELVKVAVVDHNCKLVYNKLVKPTGIVLDYCSNYTGITENDLRDVRTTLADVQRDLLELFSSETILVGHGLKHDIKVLKLFHKRVVDVVFLYPHPHGLPFRRGLRWLAKNILSYEIPEDRLSVGYNCSRNAIVAMRLARVELGEPDIIASGDMLG